MNNVTVKKSKIHGKGVFANRDFGKEESILEIDDSQVVKDESILTQYQKNFVCDWLGDKVVLMQAPERYINHYCEPNAYVNTIKGTRTLIAMRDIHKGEEITYDFAINGYYESKMNCNCGSGSCRKIINCNFFKLPKPIQRKYLPYLDDWFVKQFKDQIETMTE